MSTIKDAPVLAVQRDLTPKASLLVIKQSVSKIKQKTRHKNCASWSYTILHDLLKVFVFFRHAVYRTRELFQKTKVATIKCEIILSNWELLFFFLFLSEIFVVYEIRNPLVKLKTIKKIKRNIKTVLLTVTVVVKPEAEASYTQATSAGSVSSHQSVVNVWYKCIGKLILNRIIRVKES